MILTVFIARHLAPFDTSRLPSSILILDVVNFDDYDLFEITKYFKSDRFISDIGTCALDYDEAKYNRLTPYLKLEKPDGNLTLKLKSESF